MMIMERVAVKNLLEEHVLVTITDKEYEKRTCVTLSLSDLFKDKAAFKTFQKLFDGNSQIFTLKKTFWIWQAKLRQPMPVVIN